MARKQIINPLVGFAQRSIGPYANRIGTTTYARSIGVSSGDTDELIVNGTFDTNVGGWLVNNAIISWVSSYVGQAGVIRVADNGGFTSAYQEFATEIGEVYDCTCTAYAEPTPARVFITNQSQDVNSPDSIAGTATSASLVWQNLFLQFTAEEAVSRVKLYTEGTNLAHFDNVSVKKS